MIICPCKVGKNLRQQGIEKLYDHFIINGFDPTYEKWVLHGEHSGTSMQGDASEMPD